MAKKYYKIVPIKHLLKNNRTAKAGEKVEGGAFINLQESIDKGFCKEVKTGKKAAKKAAKIAADEEAKRLADLNTDTGNDLSGMSAKELLEYAESEGIELANKDKSSKAAIIKAIESAESGD